MSGHNDPKPLNLNAVHEGQLPGWWDTGGMDFSFSVHDRRVAPNEPMPTFPVLRIDAHRDENHMFSMFIDAHRGGLQKMISVLMSGAPHLIMDQVNEYLREISPRWVPVGDRFPEGRKGEEDWLWVTHSDGTVSYLSSQAYNSVTWKRWARYNKVIAWLENPPVVEPWVPAEKGVKMHLSECLDKAREYGMDTIWAVQEDGDGVLTREFSTLPTTPVPIAWVLASSWYLMEPTTEILMRDFPDFIHESSTAIVDEEEDDDDDDEEDSW